MSIEEQILSHKFSTSISKNDINFYLNNILNKNTNRIFQSVFHTTLLISQEINIS